MIVRIAGVLLAADPVCTWAGAGILKMLLGALKCSYQAERLWTEKAFREYSALLVSLLRV